MCWSVAKLPGKLEVDGEVAKVVVVPGVVIFVSVVWSNDYNNKAGHSKIMWRNIILFCYLSKFK